MRASEIDALVTDFVSLLRRVLYAPEGAITARTRLADLGLDSLDLVEVGLELEAMVGHDLPDIGALGTQTIGDLAARLADYEPELSLAA
jgi:acyl carrier protein